MQYCLNHLLPHRRIQIVELRCVVPRKTGSVVSVINVARLAAVSVAPPEYDRRVGLIEVMVFNLDLDAPIVR
jgi:hypothetical protein